MSKIDGYASDEETADEMVFALCEILDGTSRGEWLARSRKDLGDMSPSCIAEVLEARGNAYDYIAHEFKTRGLWPPKPMFRVVGGRERTKE